MAEVIGTASGLLALVAFAHKSGTKLYETIQSYKSLPRVARELLTDVAGLNEVLLELKAAGIDVDVDLSALEATLRQCRHACEEFEKELLKYSSRADGGRSRFRDWARFTYKGGEGVEDFKKKLSGYKATITVAVSVANLRISTTSVEAIQSCRDLIEETSLDLGDHLAEILEKLESLAAPDNISDARPDAAIIKRMEDERRSTEKGLELCLQLSQHIDQIQASFTADENLNDLFNPNPTSRILVGEGLNGCKNYISFSLQRLQKHRQKVIDRLQSNPTSAEFSNDKRLLEDLQNEADNLQNCLKFCSNVDSYLEEQISNIENDAEGDDTIQLMVSTDGKPLKGKNKGKGDRLKQAGGHFDNPTLQQVSKDFRTISIHHKDIKKSTKEDTPAAVPRAASVPPEGRFNGPGFSLASKPPVPSGLSSTSAAC